jgi:hypothetical protein
MFGDYKDVNDFKEKAGYTIEGTWYPRVTKIVGIKAKPALYYYYGEAKSFRDAQESTEQSAKEGTAIHEAVEGFLLKKNPVVDASIKPAFASFVDFFNKNNIQVTEENVEKRVVSHDHRYAGTVDAIAVIGGKLGVLDIKTSQAIYRDYNLQTSAYMDALKSQFENLETRWILKIDQIQTCLKCGSRRRIKGGRDKIKLNYKNKLSKTCFHEWSDLRGDIELQEFPYWQNDFQAFLGAKKLWEWENEDWLKKAGYL